MSEGDYGPTAENGNIKVLDDEKSITLQREMLQNHAPGCAMVVPPYRSNRGMGAEVGNISFT